MIPMISKSACVQHPWGRQSYHLHADGLSIELVNFESAHKYIHQFFFKNILIFLALFIS
jgi:hypothetical protein